MNHFPESKFLVVERDGKFMIVGEWVGIWKEAVLDHIKFYPQIYPDQWNKTRRKLSFEMPVIHLSYVPAISATETQSVKMRVINFEISISEYCQTEITIMI